MPIPRLPASHQRNTKAARFAQLKVNKAAMAKTWKTATPITVDQFKGSISFFNTAESCTN